MTRACARAAREKALDNVAAPASAPFPGAGPEPDVLFRAIDRPRRHARLGARQQDTALHAAHELIARASGGGRFAARLGATHGATHEPHGEHDEQEQDQEAAHGLAIIAKMKILVAVPGNLHTVRMNRSVPDALVALGHEVQVVDYSPTFLEKLRRRLGRKPAAEVVEARLIEAVAMPRPDLFLTLYGVNVSKRVLAELRTRRTRTANWWLNDPFQWQRALNFLGEYDFAFT